MHAERWARLEAPTPVEGSRRREGRSHSRLQSDPPMPSLSSDQHQMFEHRAAHPLSPSLRRRVHRFDLHQPVADRTQRSDRQKSICSASGKELDPIGGQLVLIQDVHIFGR